MDHRHLPSGRRVRPSRGRIPVRPGRPGRSRRSPA
ncbi:hypothetical protein Ae406Ps2_0415 [Pseudonocardia sp. Ae406_Ps2]|nr:hypothetical protein Ae406Ps2_0415 [Pseudonocardia sp. Ae406_Ps2]OLM07792.1 hypothetical protein Ae331Ps2_5502c [Pseudonocardia sp. Ae331_Ps2]OLM13962.1 hypothetical protein Ae505Ps2_4091 [Pseudonocardia sp. Ae505_Ps2]